MIAFDAGPVLIQTMRALLPGLLGASAGGLTVPALRRARRWQNRMRLPRATALGLGLGTASGMLSAWALRDPWIAALGLALGWGAGRLARQLSTAHRTLRDIRLATHMLEQVVEEASVGLDPVAALKRATERLPHRHPIRTRCLTLLGHIDRGEAIQQAAHVWAQDEPVPTLRMFARLISAWSVWGLDLRVGLSRILREAQQSVAFGQEEALERRAYEWLTWLFLGADVALGIWALAAWPRAVPSPTHTPWGRALLVLSALATALAVSLPAALEVGPETDAPNQTSRLGRA